MYLIDTSVWIDLFRDTSCERRVKLESLTAQDDIFLTRFNQLELLQGAKDEQEWQLLSSYLDTQDYLEASDQTWTEAARIYFKLRRKGLTVRSPIDCCIARIAIEAQVMLLHRDRDFLVIAEHSTLNQQFVAW